MNKFPILEFDPDPQAILQPEKLLAPIDISRHCGCAFLMEAAAFFAVAQFRNLHFGQILYGGDDLTGDEWDNRGWQKLTSTRDKLFRLAAEAVLKL